MGTTLEVEPDEVEPEKVAASNEHHTIGSQLFWLLPIALGALGVSVLLWKHQDWGADAAAIFSVPINIAAIAVTVLIDRGTFRIRALRRPRRGTRRMKGAIYFTSIALVISGGVWWAEKEPNPFDYMSGIVRVGYLNHDYPGWHEVVDRVETGFDVYLKNAIEEHFANAQLQWVPMANLQDRVDALRGPWSEQLPEGGRGQQQAPVKLVISNFSMTPTRSESIDFVGPYFVDSQGFLARTKISGLEQLPPGRVCVLNGSTSAAKLRQKGWNPVELQSLSLCLQQFTEGTVDAVSDDRSVLEAYATTNGYPPPIDLGYGSEKYGVGIPDNMPRLCRRTQAAVLATKLLS